MVHGMRSAAMNLARSLMKSIWRQERLCHLDLLVEKVDSHTEVVGYALQTDNPV